MHITTQMKNDNTSKRLLTEEIDMEVDGQSTSKRAKTASQGNDIIEVDKEYINQNDQNKPVYIENEAEKDISTSKHTIS